jgi:predicted PurR-regulated permease PerM
MMRKSPFALLALIRRFALFFMYQPKTQAVGFYILLGLSGLIVAALYWPFWELLAFALILSILFNPLYRHLEKSTKSPNFSAGVVVLLMAVIIAGPILFLGQQVFFELVNFYNGLHLSAISGSSTSAMDWVPHSVQLTAAYFNVDLQGWFTQAAGQAAASLSGLLSSLGWLFGSLVVLVFSVFFLLRDGTKIKKFLMEVLPLSTVNENILFEKLSLAINGVVKGQFLVVLTVSTASFFGFYFFGLPNALLWACVMFVAAFVPIFGTSLVWIPSVLYLYFTGHVGAAVGLTIWACACVVLIDNVMSAKVVAARVRLHPVLTIFAILGGIRIFGVLGVLLGPVLVAIFAAFLDIYRLTLNPERK